MAKTMEKKIVLVIVEGPSDEESLTVGLEGVFSGHEVAVEITRCDLTAEILVDGSRVDATNVRSRVGERKSVV